MSEIKTIVIRQMHIDDITKCMLLSDAEQWNQTEKDWKRLINGPKNHCMVAELDHRIIGTATAMNYSNEIAWIGMMLVDADFRGRGISKMLLGDLLNQLRICRSVKLDATPAGQPVYEKFGFKPEYIINRMTSSSLLNLQVSESESTPEQMQKTDINEVLQLDQHVFGAYRSYLFNSIIRDNPGKVSIIKRDGYITAFSLVRKGKRYLHIGPVISTNLRDAKDLILGILLKVHKEPVVVDVLADKQDLILWLNTSGLTKQRHFVRMYLQQNPIPGIIKNQYLICGPEFG